MAILKCPKCGGAIEKRVDRCPHCGVRLLYKSQLANGKEVPDREVVRITFPRFKGLLTLSKTYGLWILLLIVLVGLFVWANVRAYPFVNGPWTVGMDWQQYEDAQAHWDQTYQGLFTVFVVLLWFLSLLTIGMLGNPSARDLSCSAKYISLGGARYEVVKMSDNRVSISREGAHGTGLILLFFLVNTVGLPIQVLVYLFRVFQCLFSKKVALSLASQKDSSFWSDFGVFHIVCIAIMLALGLTIVVLSYSLSWQK